MTEPKGIPLSLGEARGVANQIRNSKWVDPQYWPWVIEELCKKVEELEEAVRQLTPK